MSSWKSQSSKSLLDLDGMLDIEDHLDYEPSGDESDCDADVVYMQQNFINGVGKCSSKGPNEGKKHVDVDEAGSYVQDEDGSVELPEPSGQNDQDDSNRTSSEKQSLSYGIDLEKVPSVTPSVTKSFARSTTTFRDKIRYNDLHVDVEKGSFRSKYGRHTTANKSVYLDSSSEEEECDDFQKALIDEGTYRAPVNLSNKNPSNLEDSFVYSQHEDLLYENYYPSSDNSKTYENMISPKDIWTETSTARVEKSNAPPNLNPAVQTDVPRRKPVTVSIENKRDEPPNLGHTTKKIHAVLQNGRDISSDLEQSPQSRKASSVGVKKIDASPHTVQAHTPNVQRRKLTTLSIENKRDVPPNLGQKTKKIHAVLQNRGDISSDSEQSLQSDTSSVRVEKIHASPNFDHTVQAHTPYVPQRKLTTLSIENKRGISPNLGQKTKEIHAVLQNGGDISSDSEQSLQSDTSSVRVEKIYASPNFDHTVQAHTPYVPQRKLTTLSIKNKRGVPPNLGQKTKKIHTISQNGGDISSDLEQSPQSDTSSVRVEKIDASPNFDRTVQAHTPYVPQRNLTTLSIENKRSVSPNLGQKTKKNHAVLQNGEDISSDLEQSPQSDTSSVRVERIDASPNFDHTVQAHTPYVPQRKLRTLSIENKRGVSPNLGQKTKKNHAVLQNGEDISSDLEQSPQSDTSSVRVERIDASPNFDHTVQAHTPYVPQRKLRTLSIENKRGVSPNLRQKTKKMHAVLKNGEDISSDLEQSPQSDTSSVRVERIDASPNFDHTVQAHTPYVPQRKLTTLSIENKRGVSPNLRQKTKKMHAVLKNGEDISSDLEQSPQSDTSSVRVEKIDVSPNFDHTVQAHTPYVPQRKLTTLSIENKRGVSPNLRQKTKKMHAVLKNGEDISSDLEQSPQSDTSSVRVERIDASPNFDHTVQAHTPYVPQRKLTTLSIENKRGVSPNLRQKTKKMHAVLKNGEDISSDLEQSPQSDTSSVRVERIDASPNFDHTVQAHTPYVPQRKLTTLSIENKRGVSPNLRQKTKKMHAVLKNGEDISSDLEQSPQSDTSSVRVEKIDVSPNFDHTVQAHTPYVPQRKLTTLSIENKRGVSPNLRQKTKKMHAVLKNGEDISSDLEQSPQSDTSSVRVERIDASPNFDHTVQAHTPYVPQRKLTTLSIENKRGVSPNLGQKTKKIHAVLQNDRDISSDLEQSPQSDTSSVRVERIDASPNSDHTVQARTPYVPRRKLTTLSIENKRGVSPNLGQKTKKIHAVLQNDRDISSDLEQSPQSDTSSVRDEKIDASPNFDRTVQARTPYVPRRKLTTLSIENKRDVSPNLEQKTRDTAAVSPRKIETTARKENGDDISPDLDQSTSSNLTVLPQKKRNNLNFSIKVVGNERIFLIPSRIIKRRPKPWVSIVENYINYADIIKLTSADGVIEFLPKNRNSVTNSRSGQYTSSNSSGSDAGMLLFKVPLKRPPTRQKGTNKNLSVSVNLQSQKRQVEDIAPLPTTSLKNNPNDADDIISLMASSCHLSMRDEPLERHDIFVKEERISLSQSSRGTEKAKLERTEQWIFRNNEPKKTVVPNIYKGLCYNHFLNNSCLDKHCTRSHDLVNKHTQINQLPLLNVEDLTKAYKFALQQPFLYSHIYEHFAKAFASKDMKSELVQMINVIFEETSYNINLEKGLESVLSALQETNLTTFEDTVEYLLLQIGLKRYPHLGNVLLEIILKKPDVSRHWPIIRRLIIAGEKMSCKMGTKFLVHLMKSPVNLKVCQEVYHHILLYKYIDLPNISSDIREPFLKICSQENIARVIEANVESNLCKERINFERRTRGNVTVPMVTLHQDISVSPRRGTFGKSQLPSSLACVASTDFGSGISNQQDFASLSVQNKVASPPALQPDFLFNYPSSQSRGNGDRKSQTSGSPHDVDLRFRHPVVGEHSSDDGDHLSDSNSCNDHNKVLKSVVPIARKRHAQKELVYNREGLQYDPANDYVPLPKRRTTEPPSKFDRLKRNNGPSSRLNPDGGEPALHRVYLTEEGVGPAFHRPNNDMARSAAVTENPVGVVVESAFFRRNHGDQNKARPSHHTLHHDEEGERAANQYGVLQNLPSMRQTQLWVRNGDDIVSSSTDAKLKYEKPSEHPKFGKLSFDPNYEFNISLHNMYLQAIDNLDIDEEDVHRLNDCVKNSNGSTFLALVDKYKGPKTVQNFISMTLAHLKGMNQMVARTYRRLLERIEVIYPEFYGNRCLRVILEVITLNLLFELNNRHMLDDANILLNKFSDWDSLVTSRIFIINATQGISIIGRYLFIAKILNHSRPELAYEILICPTLHLLEKYEIWPYHPSCPIPEIFNSDFDTRNDVITVFLKTGYLLNPVSVIQLYKTAFKKGIWKFDVKPYFDPMMKDLIERNHSSLKLFNNEIDMFHKYMTQDTLRAFLITLSQHVSEKDLFVTYEKCADRNIYQKLVGRDHMEYNVEIRANMHACEINLIIKYYFYKLEEIRKVPPGSTPLRFEIKLSDPDCCPPARYKSLPLLNKNISLFEINDIIKKSLTNLCIRCSNVLPNIVEVEKMELVNFLDRIWT